MVADPPSSCDVRRFGPPELTERPRRFQDGTGPQRVARLQLTDLSIVVYFIWGSGLYVQSAGLALPAFVALFRGGVFFVLTHTLFKLSIDAQETEAYGRARTSPLSGHRLPL
jgi:hypothetical protein